MSAIEAKRARYNKTWVLEKNKSKPKFVCHTKDKQFETWSEKRAISWCKARDKENGVPPEPEYMDVRV